MTKYYLALALALFGVVGPAMASEPLSTPATKEQVMRALYDEYQTGECFDGNIASGEVTEGWVCYAKDCYTSFESDVKLCKDHAQKSALAVCERLSRDKKQCQLVAGDGQCCRKPLK